MKWFLPVLSLSTLFCVGCGALDREVSVMDVTKSETLILKKMSEQGLIVGISISGSGSIVGKAEVQLILNGEVYKSEKANGRVSFKWGGDWYADEAEVRYIPSTVSNGTITISYDFHDIKLNDAALETNSSQ